MRKIVSIAFTLLLTGCASRESQQEQHHDANTVAGKAGQLAHKAAVETDKAGRVVAHKMQRAAHDAHEGWKEDERKKQDQKQ